MEQRRYWVAPYGGTVGLILAVVVGIAALVLWLTHALDGTTAALFIGLALSRIL